MTPYTSTLIAAAILVTGGAIVTGIAPVAGLLIALTGFLYGFLQTLNLNLATIRAARMDDRVVNVRRWAVQYFGCVAVAALAMVALAVEVLR